jgi:hypothetical protein
LALVTCGLFVPAAMALQAYAIQGGPGSLQSFPNDGGQSQTFSAKGPINLNEPFFRSLGENGRSCASCHQPGEGWSITPRQIRARFEASVGLDPLFRPVDGANCDTADVSSMGARRSAYSLLLNKGLIRVALPVPPNAEFTVTAVQNPYGCDSNTTVSVYRRPLPSANIRFLSTVMWDGRESVAGNTLEQNLMRQANNANLIHAEASRALTNGQRKELVAFQMGLLTAQSVTHAAGDLIEDGARGGAQFLSEQEFFIGINDPLGENPTGAPFNPVVFDIFDAWSAVRRMAFTRAAAARQSIARGQDLFNTQPIDIRGVAGLNDDLGQVSIPGTCTTCHDAPNVGHHSVPLAINIGVSDAKRRTPDLPLFTLVNKATNRWVQTTDPGRALITGKWRDIGKTKGPILRSLAARAPYFHNGSAATLLDVVTFYEERFRLRLSAQEKTDLVAFLGAL